MSSHISELLSLPLSKLGLEPMGKRKGSARCWSALWDEHWLLRAVCQEEMEGKEAPRRPPSVYPFSKPRRCQLLLPAFAGKNRSLPPPTGLPPHCGFSVSPGRVLSGVPGHRFSGSSASQREGLGLILGIRYSPQSMQGIVSECRARSKASALVCVANKDIHKIIK